MPKKTFIAVLDWGLGHATRCIPIIEELLAEDQYILIGSSGNALKLLKQEFPLVSTIELPPYNIRYPSKNMVFNIVIQLPRIISTIIREYFQLKSIIQRYNIDQVISDNRFGCFNRQVYSIFMTHQINIITPKLFSFIVNNINHWLINHFDECWIPDFEEGTRLSGRLSFPSYSLNVKYIGPQSRMKPLEKNIKYEIIAVLSGPEPQRSILEKKILRQLVEMPFPSLIVQGLPKVDSVVSHQNSVALIPFLNGKLLNEEIAAARIVICRSGYSSIMDLAVLGKKAILIPTPGQTEQEYLATYFEEQRIFLAQKQSEFNLEDALNQIEDYIGLQIN